MSISTPCSPAASQGEAPNRMVPVSAAASPSVDDLISKPDRLTPSEIDSRPPTPSRVELKGWPVPRRRVKNAPNGANELPDSNGPGAFEVFQLSSPTIVQVLERIRDEDTLADLPVLMLTARSREDDVVEGFKRGATDYVTKPFSPNEVVARIKRMLPST